jgi:DNA repair photolyase
MNCAIPHSIISNSVGMMYGNETPSYVINPYDHGCDYKCLYCGCNGRPAIVQDSIENVEKYMKMWVQEHKNETIYIGPHSECMGPSERKYHLTETIMRVLCDNDAKFSIITKSPDIAHYINLLDNSTVQMSIITKNASKAAEIEVGAPSPFQRLEAMHILVDAGINTITRIEPIIQGCFDFDLIDSIAESGIKEVWVGLIRPIYKNEAILDKVRELYSIPKPIGYNTSLFDQHEMASIYTLINDYCKEIGINCRVIDPNWRK